MGNSIKLEARTIIFNIKPKGLGTPYVESLSSYISRLSMYHCFTTGNFVSKLMAPYLGKYYISEIAKRGGNGFLDSAIGINGIGTLAIDFINVIQLLNQRKDIQKLTLVYWSGTLPTRGLMKEQKAWCPLCFHENLVSKEFIYEQLLWYIKSVNCCPKHKIQLETRCPNCSKTQKILSRKTKPGYCLHCNIWLGNSDISSLVEADAVELQESMLVGGIISYSSSGDPQKLKDNVVAESFRKISEVLSTLNIRELSKLLTIPETTLRYWINGNNLAPLPSIIKVCLVLKISILQFLGVEEMPSQLLPIEISSEPNPQPRVRFDYEKLKKVLNDRINNDESLSLKKVAELIGCDRKLLYQKFPIESKIIVEKHRKFLENQKLKRQEEVNTNLESAIMQLVENGEYPSRRKVEELLGQKYFVKERGIGEEWNKLKQNAVRSNNT